LRQLSGTQTPVSAEKEGQMRAPKPIVEYQWEARNPDGKVMKRGPIRTDLAKVVKYKVEIESEILAGNFAPYWNDLSLHIVTRTITPWKALQSQASETKV